MSTFTASGIVIKEIFYGESDKLITLLLFGHGRIAVYCRGARKPKSKFMAGTQPLVYAEFVILDGVTKNNSRFYSLCQVSIINSYFKLRNSFETLCSSNYFLEISDKTVIEGIPCDELIYLILSAFESLLTHTDAMCESMRAEAVVGIFRLAFLSVNGYTPQVMDCSVCGSKIDYDKDKNDGTESKMNKEFYYGKSGIVCSRCHNARIEITLPVSAKCAEIIRIANDYDDYSKGMGSNVSDMIYILMDMQYKDKDIKELDKISDFMLKSHFHFRLMSLEMLSVKRP